jgi:hypothetical protein
MGTVAIERENRRLALSYAFVEKRADGDWGDAWIWDMNDPRQATITWLGFISHEAAKWYADDHGSLSTASREQLQESRTAAASAACLVRPKRDGIS